ncbi:MAG: hypothetical protein M3530_10605 [Thermoproteota archaeon]|nr:hypothetical protein [Thermoproteota archaeon]
MKLKKTRLAFIVGIVVVVGVGIYAGFDTYNNSIKMADQLNQSQALKDLQERRMSILEYCSHGFTDNESQKLCTGVRP